MEKLSTKRWRFDAFPYLMSLPALIGIGLICFYPMFQGIYLSFTNTKLTSPNVMRFVGMANFKKLAVDSQFWNSFYFTIVYTLVSTLFAYLLGLAVALMMNRELKIKNVIRALLLLPWVVPAVVGTTAWQWILNDQSGVINIFLRNVGIIKSPILFLANPDYAVITVIAFCVWKTFPFMAITILASLQGISGDINEAALMDGTNLFQKFYYITLPMIKRESILAIMLMIMWNFNRMDYIYLMTQGGPVSSTRVSAIYAYFTAFFRGSLGSASTISVSMMLVMTAFLFVYFKMRKEGND